MVLVCIFVVMVGTLPIYGFDSMDNITKIKSDLADGNSMIFNEKAYIHDDSSDLENTTSGKYKDIQDLRLKILEILEGLRLARDENVTQRRGELRQLENELNLLKKQMAIIS